MNRQQRKKMEKDLGIHKSQKKLTRQQKFDLLEKNISSGKAKQEEMKDVRRLQEQASEDQIIQKQIASRATTYMIKDKLPYGEAYEKAKEDFEK